MVDVVHLINVFFSSFFSLFDQEIENCLGENEFFSIWFFSIEFAIVRIKTKLFYSKSTIRLKYIFNGYELCEVNDNYNCDIVTSNSFIGFVAHFYLLLIYLMALKNTHKKEYTHSLRRNERCMF